MAETLTDADRVSKMLGQQNLIDVDYSKYENIKLAAQKRKSAGETNKLRNQKILVSPLRAFHPTNGQSENEHKYHDFATASSRKSVDSDRREVLIARRCQTETKELTGRRKRELPTPCFDLNTERIRDVLRNDSDVRIKRVIRKSSPLVAKDLKPKPVDYPENVDRAAEAKKIERIGDTKSRKSPSLESSRKKDEVRLKRQSPLPENNQNFGEHAKRRESPVPKRRESPIPKRGASPVPKRKESPVPKRKDSPKTVANDAQQRQSDQKTSHSSDSRSDTDKPLMEVRRRLDFEREEAADDVTPLPQKGLDFTDKIAALRTLINKDRDTKRISDRRAYYDEYRSSHRKVIVSRSDSLKENENDGENVNNNADRLKVEEHSDKPKVSKSDGRRVQSADIFRDKNLDGRLSAMDLQVLKERLEDKQRSKDERKTEQNGRRTKANDDADREDLVHARRGRKILASSRKCQSEADKYNDPDGLNESDNRPSSRLESKETQTNQLNQSIRSVQSNVPFFEPQRRPGSAPVFNCEISAGKRKVYKHRKQPNEGIERGVNLKGMEKSSPSRDDRQTNVGSNYVGTSLTPEKNKDKHRHRHRNNELGDDGDDHFSRKKRQLDKEKLKNDTGNHRPSSRSSQIGFEDEIQGINSNSNKVVNTRRHRTKSNGAVTEDLISKKHGDSEVERITSKSERKVREWMKRHDMLTKGRSASANFESTPLMMEELNISISIPANGYKDVKLSPTDSCDRIPVKLEKQKNEKSHTLSQPGAIGYIEPKNGNTGYLSNRKAIFDRLEQISMAVTTKKPVKDLNGRKSVEPVKQRQEVENSDSADTESSIFSLPFSIQSCESMSSTVQAVKLLRRLYNVDTETRQNLVLMAKCFRRWFNNVLHAKAHNLQITNAAKRVSPISYGVMLRKGDICYRDSQLSQYFGTWKTAYRNAQLHHKVEQLHRRHTLQKGMNAFKWSINRSKLQQGILQDRVNTMLLQCNFNKWKLRTLENRRLRLQQAFLRWRQYTKEAQKIRMLRNQTNLKLKGRVFLKWYDNYQTRLNEHRADKHHRQVVLSQGWFSWRCFTINSKEKKLRQALAMELFQMTLQRKMFTCMKIEFAKFTVAKSFHRKTQLKVSLLAWRIGVQVSCSERESDMRVAEAYWSHSTLRAHFSAWRDSLLTNKACKMCNGNMLKDAFILWHRRHQHLVQRREAVDTYRRQKIMTQAFRHWCDFVSIMKRRRAAAVECLQSVLQRHMFSLWRWYTTYQKNLRKRMLLHVRKHNLDTQRRCLTLWRSNFRVKCDEKRAQQLWSNSCAKKAAEVWRLVCHKRRLARLLIDTEPLRHLHTQRVFFMKWKSKFGVILEEKYEAADVRYTLDTSQLRQRFDKWRYMTQQLLLIKPMVLRYRRQLITDCFTGWRQYVTHKAECVRSEKLVTTIRLKNKFNAWRRQYQVHQIEKEVRRKCEERQTRTCLTAWRGVIQRKHTAHKFHSDNLQKRLFNYWNMMALRQLREKHLHKMEMETVMCTLREYFDRWREQVYHQQSRETEGVTYLQNKLQNNRVKVTFYFWRRHFRATLVARENEKIRVRKLAKQAVKAWHRYTQNSMQESVERFAAAIGLHQGDGDTGVEELDTNMEDRGVDLEAQLGRGDMFEPMNFDLALSPRSVTPKTPRTPRTPRTPITPKYPSLYGTPHKRITSPALSQASLARSMEFEAGVLTSSSFLDARFEMEQAVKTESRREIVVTVVHRLRHWPVSIMFDQWREYTSRQREFKLLSTQMINVHQELSLKQYFNTWVQHHREMRLAKQHYEQVLQHKALLSLILYRNARKQKKHLNTMAVAHYAQKVYTQVFPMWLEKAQEKQKAERIVHLWTNITDEERELIPRERSFRYKLNKKSLTECYKLWFQKYQRINKLKKLYHKILLERYFGMWSRWALERHERRVKCDQFRDMRTKKLVFKAWCLRHTQRTEVEKRYTDTWHNYLGVIVQSWSVWAKEQRRRTLVANHIVAVRNRHTVVKMFQTWKQTYQKHAQITQWHENRLMTRVLYAWQSVAVWQKDLRERQHQCQLMSYTILAKRAFRQWRESYTERLEQHQHHELLLQQRVLHIATKWRHRAQVTRGAHARKHFQGQQLKRLFATWKSAYGRNMDRYHELEVHLSYKNSALLSRYLATWRTELMCLQATRVFNMKLMVTLTLAWKQAAKGCRERRQILQTYQSRKDNHVQKGYFLYWYNVAKARKSIRGHANLKMQLNVFKAWLVYTRKKNNLRRLESALTKRHNQHTLQKHWYLMKTRFDYCVELSDMASRVIHEKNLELMRQALQHWDFRLKIVIADECHEHILAKRVANRWCRFVQHKRRERQHMLEMTHKAVKFYQKTLCNKVYRSWYNEVLATRHAEMRRQRLCKKYGQLWKYRVDMAYTALCIREENLCMTAWKIWHLEFARRKAIQKVEAFERKQQLTMVFVSWKNLCRKRARRISMIPLPVSPAANMPSAGTSNSSTSSLEDLAEAFFPSKSPDVGSTGLATRQYSDLTIQASGLSARQYSDMTTQSSGPVRPSDLGAQLRQTDPGPPAYWARPTQIPVPNQIQTVTQNSTQNNKNKSRLPSLSARNSPTSSNGASDKLSTYDKGRKESIY